MPLTEEQWLLVSDLFPVPDPGLKSGAGRPPLDRRFILDGILWKLANRQPWRNVPACFGSHQACYLYYHQWLLSGLLRSIVITLFHDAQDRGGFDLDAAIKSHKVHIEKVANRFQVYVLPSLASSWQFQVVLLYYQYLAAKCEHELPGSSPSPDPLERIIDRVYD